MVPPIGPQVTVEGMVRRPAIYEVKDETNLASVLELAGGLLPTATLRHIEVQRTIAHEKQTMLSLDIPASDDDAAATKKLESFKVQDGDRIRVFPITQGNEDAVYLEGHVIRPGPIFVPRGHARDGLDFVVTRISCPSLLLEYAEIIRLNAPDFHPTVESFDLQEALANPSKRRFSTRWIRFEFSADSISRIHRPFRSWETCADRERIRRPGRFTLRTPFIWRVDSLRMRRPRMPKYFDICPTGRRRFSASA